MLGENGQGAERALGGSCKSISLSKEMAKVEPMGGGGVGGGAPR